ncbi:MAG TPA: DUF4097 family beta strand repeat-containing protein [Terriglobales bacterium]|nr:DUF4097 family beta strand repeat-containing protein [Terriglobales bacterium]
MRRRYETNLALVVLLVTASVAVAETRKEFRFPVSGKASVSITNVYGPISVKSAQGGQIFVIAILKSDKVEVDRSQSGDRIDLVSHLLPGADMQSGQVEYDVQVPIDTAVTLHTTTGSLTAEKLQGDLSVEGAAANVSLRDIANAHVHVKTLDGPITLANIVNGHVEVTSISGNVVMTAVNGKLVEVNSASGKIRYDGDFGYAGVYILSSHTGDIEATAPSYASFDVSARSEKGKVENDFTLEPKHTSFVVKAGSAFAGTMNKAASSVKLFSMSGKIHLKKR